MTYAGIVRGNTIELENRTELPDGTRVHVDVVPQDSPRKGSPQAVLRLAGTLTNEEADTILAATQLNRRVDVELWEAVE
jgi:hypothetical protein